MSVFPFSLTLTLTSHVSMQAFTHAGMSICIIAVTLLQLGLGIVRIERIKSFKLLRQS